VDTQSAFDIFVWYRNRTTNPLRVYTVGPQRAPPSHSQTPYLHVIYPNHIPSSAVAMFSRIVSCLMYALSTPPSLAFHSHNRSVYISCVIESVPLPPSTALFNTWSSTSPIYTLTSMQSHLIPQPLTTASRQILRCPAMSPHPQHYSSSPAPQARSS